MHETAGVLQRSGSSIHYWVAGPKRAPLIAFTHGGSMDHRMFEPQLQPVWDAGYRTFRWDIRGHGRSRPFGKLPLTLTSVAEDLIELLDSLLLGRQACLVGQAFGGQVAQQVLLQRPERVAALVVVGAGCLTLPLSPPRAWAARWLPLVRGLRSAGELRHRLARSAAVVPAVQTYAFEAAERLTRRELVAVGRAAASVVRPEPGYRIEQPVLLVHGEHDRMGRVRRAAPTWAARDPRCRYEVIREAGHQANQDNPATFNRILLEFLGEHVPVPRGIR